MTKLNTGRGRTLAMLLAGLAGLAAGTTDPALAQLDLQKQFGGAAAARQEYGDSRDVVDVSVVADRTRVAPGDRVRVAVILDHHEGYHVHTNDPQVPRALGSPDDYFKTIITADATPGSPLRLWTPRIQWPEVHEIEVAWFDTPVRYGVFADRAIAYIPVTVAADAPLGPASFTVKAAFQACNDIGCMRPTPYPPSDPAFVDEEWARSGVKVSIEIVAPADAQSQTEIDPDIFGGFDESVWGTLAGALELVRFDLFGIVHFDLNVAGAAGFTLLLLVAALGGFLLNLTPCVLPVIPIKILSIAHTAGSRGRTLLIGLVMSGGVVAFWMGLAVTIASLSTFTATNQLFQYPLFTIGVGAVIAVMAVGMCGVFSLRLPQAVAQVSPRLDSLPGSFAFGIMTAVLSTPCTAPFMGAALAWAAGKAPSIILATFASIGAGMALPYLVLSAFPKLTQRMPRTGPASELIKQVMGLLMLAAAAYFVGVGLSGLLADPADPPSRAYWWFVGGFGVAAGGWMAWKTLAITRSPARWAIFGGLGAAMLVLSAYVSVSLTDKGPIEWVYYTPQRFAEAKAAGDVVVMEFTAEWCLNCKALEQSVLRQEDLVRALNGEGVTPIKVDLTGNNVPGNQMLKEVDRRTIPLLVIFDPEGTEVFKGDYYTARQVLDAIDAARESAVAQSR